MRRALTMARHLPSLSALLLAVASGATAQEVIWHAVGAKGSEWLAGPVAIVGDLDRDGYEDVTVIRWTWNPDPQPGEVLLLSGRDGSRLRQPVRWQDSNPKTRYSYYRVAKTGDMDGDGVPDYACVRVDDGGGGPDAVDARSGRDDRVLWSATRKDERGYWGIDLLGDLDIDGDGRPNLLVAAPREPAGYFVYAYDQRGVLLARWPIITTKLGRIGDVDRDGRDDFVTQLADAENRGGALVWSGLGKQMVSGLGELPGDALGTGNVTGVGDVDGDGVLDFAASSHGLDPVPPVARVFSGKTGQPIYSWRGGPGFGLGLAAADVDLDGVNDLLVAPGPPAPGPRPRSRISVLSLRDGRLSGEIYPMWDTSSSPGIGNYLAASGPQPGSPYPVVVQVHPYEGANYPAAFQGRVTLLRILPRGVASYGQGCAGTLEAAPRLGMRDYGAQGIGLSVAGAPAGAPALLLLGLSPLRWGSVPLPLPLDGLGFPGCKLLTSVEAALVTMTGTAGTARGFARIDVPWPLATSLAIALHGQWLVLGQGKTAPGGLTWAMAWGH